MGTVQHTERVTGRAARLRLLASGLLAGVVVVTAFALPSAGGGSGLSLAQQNEADKAARGLPHVDPAGAPAHTHDLRFKNSLARGGEAVSADAADPTTAAERRAAADYVATERAQPDPRLTTTPFLRPRTTYPADRYAMANGCYTLRTPGGAYLRRADGGFALGGTTRARADRFFFKATALGSYLLLGRTGDDFLTGPAASGAVTTAAEPSTRSEWRVSSVPGAERPPRYHLRLPGDRPLVVRSGRLVIAAAGGAPTGLVIEGLTGCTPFPESQIGVTGLPHAGVTSYQEVRGYVDAHTHGMAYEFLGGEVHCGKPWDKYGVEHALVDCEDHTLTGGNGALLEAFLSENPSHDPVGWPTFEDWPAPDSLTHEGTYYRWMERSWRGGQRLLVNLLVENNKLCEVYPLKRNSCDDMDSIRLQARRMHQFENYVDAQFGGPGRGFYRIVTSPMEARRVINNGQMAVVMGIETSVPFGCTFKALPGGDVPACDRQDITQQINEMYRMGVRQMELVNKFDNALAGVAGDTGTTGVVVNTANFLETGTFWDMEHCEPADGESSDRAQAAIPEISPQQQDALFGAIGEVFGPGGLPALPIYGPPAHCNSRGLTSLGEHTVREIVRHGMVFDPDHLSVKARQMALDVIDDTGHMGVISSHSWATPDSYPRIYEEGGFITPYAGDSTGFVDKWKRHVGWADPRYYWGIGFGADINGLGAQGDPRGADVSNPVTYPFRGLNGVTVHQQRAGQRVYDINVDGVAQYGLYPDWVQDLRMVAGRARPGDGAALLDDMARGTEAYLQMWERSIGIAPDSCRNPRLRLSVGRLRAEVRTGMSTTAVMRAVGQPYRRLGTTYGVCARTADRARVMVTIEFGRGGRVVAVRT